MIPPPAKLATNTTPRSLIPRTAPLMLDSWLHRPRKDLGKILEEALAIINEDIDEVLAHEDITAFLSQISKDGNQPGGSSQPRQ